MNIWKLEKTPDWAMRTSESTAYLPGPDTLLSDVPMKPFFALFRCDFLPLSDFEKARLSRPPFSLGGSQDGDTRKRVKLEAKMHLIHGT